MSNSNKTEHGVAPAPVVEKSLFVSIKEALKGSHLDYTEGPIGHAILLLAIPMVLKQSLKAFSQSLMFSLWRNWVLTQLQL